MKLLKKLPDGKFKVNKAAVIAKLVKASKARKKVLELGVIQPSKQEVEQEARELSRYRADSFIQGDE
jgi:hypothetical protein